MIADPSRISQPEGSGAVLAVALVFFLTGATLLAAGASTLAALHAFAAFITLAIVAASNQLVPVLTGGPPASTRAVIYRAVDACGKTIDFRLSPKRDVAAAKAFFRKAFKTQGLYAAHHHPRRVPGLPSGRAQALRRASKAPGHQGPLVSISQQYR